MSFAACLVWSSIQLNLSRDFLNSERISLIISSAWTEGQTAVRSMCTCGCCGNLNYISVSTGRYSPRLCCVCRMLPSQRGLPGQSPACHRCSLYRSASGGCRTTANKVTMKKTHWLTRMDRRRDEEAI